jgi:CheY-like chemotaxis protein
MGLKVLLVDDDDMVLYLHKAMLKINDLSSNPVSFQNGKAALDYLKEQYQAGDNYLILLDINMPVMSGWQFLEAIQTMPFADNLSIIMATSSIDQVDRQRAYQYKQVIDYVEKPLDVAWCKKIRLLPRIANLI